MSLVFVYGTDLDRARAQVDRAISTVRPTLPEDVEPQALAGSISDLPIVFMAVSSDQTLSELNGDLARRAILCRLEPRPQDAKPVENLADVVLRNRPSSRPRP